MDDRADKRMLAEPAAKPNRSASGRARKGTSDAAFDLWLQRGLHAMYDDIAKEPIPEELLRLIEQDRDQSPRK
ncbi:hypothetical protein CR162_10360 [Pseudoroseomonas rhizosphaerae]|uniref:Anti-sigma factor NepR domain-containing protein n=1 Tax=Teichococcus rhizosphaerae TaxID=1335062 RepID=A0A2C7ADE6_9PROT|nr:NepR family anti-sigma factor [Pseudoroseomonas rhizosphaerae]PHK95136.1 hypothetical protein CR162_10360 [Pseudoroseomonas rhizosphaerae]